MRYRLRVLLIVLALGAPVLANSYFAIAPKSTPQRRQKGIWITSARFNGNRRYSDSKLAKVIGIENGTGPIGFRLTTDLAVELRNNIEQLYYRAGYRHATVKVRTRTGPKSQGKELIFDIREGTPIARRD
jgi:outer membrane protein assembly factor BamA